MNVYSFFHHLIHFINSLISRQTEQTIGPYVIHIHGDRVTSNPTCFLTLTKTWTSVAGICMCYHMHYTGVDLGSNTSEDIIISLRGKTVSDLYIYRFSNWQVQYAGDFCQDQNRGYFVAFGSIFATLSAVAIIQLVSISVSMKHRSS